MLAHIHPEKAQHRATMRPSVCAFSGCGCPSGNARCVSSLAALAFGVGARPAFGGGPSPPGAPAAAGCPGGAPSSPGAPAGVAGPSSARPRTLPPGARAGSGGQWPPLPPGVAGGSLARFTAGSPLAAHGPLRRPMLRPLRGLALSPPAWGRLGGHSPPFYAPPPPTRWGSGGEGRHSTAAKLPLFCLRLLFRGGLLCPAVVRYISIYIGNALRPYHHPPRHRCRGALVMAAARSAISFRHMGAKRAGPCTARPESSLLA